LRSILPDHKVFHFNNMAELNSIIKSLTVVPKQIEPAIRLWFSPTSNVLQKSRDNLTIAVTCTPDEPLNSLPKDTEIRFLPNSFFYGSKAILGEEATARHPVKIIVTLLIKPEAVLIGEFPEKIWWEAIIPGAPRGKYRGSVSMLLGWLAGDFIFQDDPNRFINLLIWGPMGAGKTSFINGLITTFSANQEVDKALTAYRSDTHVTKSYSANLLVDSLNNQNSSLEENIKNQLKIRVFDPWGLTQTNYKKLSILHFIEGRVPEGSALNDNPCTNPVVANNQIDAVIFLIPIGTSQSPDLLEVLAGNIQCALETGMRPIVIINYLNNLKDEDELKRAYDVIYSQTHLSHNDIFEIDNYDHEKIRNMEKDLQYWKILKKVFNEATKNIRNRNRKQGGAVTGCNPVTPKSTEIQCRLCQKIFSTVFKKCPYCGDTQSIGAARICPTTGCKNFEKEVSADFPLCPFCGKAPKDRKAEGLRQCTNSVCKNFEKEVSADFPLCPFCGKAPTVPSHSKRSCISPGCNNFRKEVSLDFPLCPFCGKPPSTGSPSGGSVCPLTTCKNYNKEVSPEFPRCPFCGTLTEEKKRRKSLQNNWL
jgi:hypothetical protein